MISLKAEKRDSLGKNFRNKKENAGLVPGILYGPEIKNISLKIDMKDFEKAYGEAGESSLISLEVDGKKYLALINAVEIDPLSQKPLHIDFYHPKMDEEITAYIPLVFEGDALAVKDLGGTLVKLVQEVEIRALPKDLPHEIKVDIGKLKTFDDSIAVKDLNVPPGVRITKEAEEDIALVTPPERVEEELEKPIEEKVEEVGESEEKAEKKEEGEEGGEKKEQ